METEPARWSIRAEELLTQTPDGAVLVVSIGDYMLPLCLRATIKRVDVSDFPTLNMEVEMSTRRPVITELTLGRPSHPTADGDAVELAGPSSSYGGGACRPITASLLRELPLTRLARYAMLGVAWNLGKTPSEKVVSWDLRDDEGFYEIGPEITAEVLGIPYFGVGMYAGEEPWSGSMQDLADHVERLRSPRRRRRIDDDLLNRVAKVYRQALAEGHPPKKAVRDALFVSEATAGRYVMQARGRGFLGATLPGKKGEHSA